MKHHVLSLFGHLKRSKLLSLAIKLGLTLAAFWLVLRNIDFTTLAELGKRQDHERVVEVMLLILMQIGVGAQRWRLILMALSNTGKHILSLLEVLKLYYISVFFSCCLPGTVGGDVIRVWMVKSDHVPLSLSINSVIIDRVIALAALGLLVVATLPMLGSSAGLNVLLIVPLIVVAGIFGVWFLIRMEKLLTPHQNIRPVRWLLYFIGCLRMLLKYPAASLAALLYSLVGHLSYCLSGYVLAQSLGIDISVIECITLLPLVMLIVTIPISIGGWGIREASMVGMLALVGVPQAEAVMLSIELGLVNILVSLPAGLLWLGYRRHTSRAHAASTIDAI